MECYAFRPAYPAALHEQLLALIEGPRVVLDAGCGPGKLALALEPYVERVDAVDPSAAMLAAGRGAARNGARVRWIRGSLEEAPLDGPYGLAVAGASFHWMDADVVLPRLAGALAAGAPFAVLDGDGPTGHPWRDAETDVMRATVSGPDGTPPPWWADPEEREQAPLVAHACFEPLGARAFEAPARQTLDDYLRCLHSRQSFSAAHLGAAASARFDAAMREVLAPWAIDGSLSFTVRTRLEWGRPIA